MKIALKNYTTQIKVEKTTGEIEALLASFGAKRIMKDYNENGVLDAISFIIETERGMMPFKMPMKLEKVYAVICQSRIPNRLKTREQAARVGWRIIKDWLHSQLSLIQIEMAKIEEIMLPYMQNNEGKTMFELLEEKGFNLNQIENRVE